MLGLRLDSGDLKTLSQEVRKILNEGGFSEASIVASSDLDEYTITDLKKDGAEISAWGVGTRLATAYDEPALGGVYKLTAVRKKGESWSHRIKRSDEVAKISLPGIHQVRRFSNQGKFSGDLIYELQLGPDAGAEELKVESDYEDLLVPIFKGGSLCYDLPSLDEIRKRLQQQLEKFDPALQDLKAKYLYPVHLERKLSQVRAELLEGMHANDEVSK